MAYGGRGVNPFCIRFFLALFTRLSGIGMYFCPERDLVRRVVMSRLADIDVERTFSTSWHSAPLPYLFTLDFDLSSFADSISTHYRHRQLMLSAAR